MTARAVHWYEGMFLRPHHFQAAERHRHHLSQRNDKIDQHYNWGIRSVQIDLDALGNYRFEIQSLLARLRDGTIVEVPQDGTLPALELKEILQQNNSVIIYLALPVVNLAKANAIMERQAEGARFLVDVQELEDENTGVNPQPVQVRLLNLRLLLSTQDHTGFDVLPLARLQKSFRGDAVPELDVSFIPPLLACDGWHPLNVGLIRHLYDRIGKKIEILAGQVLNRGITLESRGQGDAGIIAQLRELNYSYSRLQVLAFAQGVHPLDMYLELAGLVGRLSIFGSLRRPPEIPRYDHDDLGGCYYRLKQYLDELLELVVEPPYLERPFMGAGLRMQVSLEPTWLDPTWQMFIGVQSRLSPEECIRLLTGTGQLDMKVGSSERVDAIYRLGQAGLQFVPRPQPPNVLPSSPGLIYFQLRRDTQPVEWQNIQKSLTLALRLNENRIAGNIQGERTLTITLGNQTVPIQFTLYVLPGGSQE